MNTRVFERENETINLSEYGFEWYVDNKVVKTGLIEDIDETIALLENEGFVEIV